jgi:DNA modification methylase
MRTDERTADGFGIVHDGLASSPSPWTQDQVCVDCIHERETLDVVTGVLYCGDNLDVLTEYLPSSSVDLIYLDPPFNSQRTYNTIYKGSTAQEEVFKDYWSWAESADTYEKLVKSGETPKPVRTMLHALHELLVETDSDQLAYVTMMTARLIALRRVLKSTGSLFLHCDSTASHYLKVVLDALFGRDRFMNEIIWKRSSAHSDTKQGARHFGRISDTILFYAKGETSAWTQLYGPYSEKYIEENYKRRDPDGRVYRIDNIQGPGGASKGNPIYEFLGVTRYWRYSRERMQKLYDEGRIIQTRPGAVPQYKRYLDEMPGVPLQNVWTDISVINNRSNEYEGYPTQKPVALLERIVMAASNPGDIVLDPFCGCGTTIAACEKLGRRWIGIDIAHKAVDVIEGRFKKLGLESPQVTWHPVDAQSALALANRDKRKFEEWIRRKLQARKRERDRGIDGEAFFRDAGAKLHHVIISVKGGKLKPTDLRDLRGTIEREEASIGVLVTVDAPSKEIQLEAARAKFLAISDDRGPIPRLQVVRVDDEFFKRYPVRVPGVNVTDMPREDGEQLALALNAVKGIKTAPFRSRAASAATSKKSVPPRA